MTFPLMPLPAPTVSSGTTWFVVPSGTTRTLKNVATDAAGVFVIASTFSGANTLVFRSADNGASWAPVTVSASSFSLWGCIRAGSTFVVTGDGSGADFTSATGASWADLAFPPPQVYRNSAYNDGWAAFGANNGLSYYSQDLTTFYTAPSIGANSALAAIYVSSLNRTVAVGVPSQSKYFNGLPSALSAWTGSTSGISGNARSVAWHGAIGVLVTDSGLVQSSTDLIAWTTQYTDARPFNAVAWCNDRFIAVGNGGVAVQSFDGVAWTPTAIATTEDLWGVAYGNGAIVVAGANGLILRSVS